jgi:hypothetical protein
MFGDFFYIVVAVVMCDELLCENLHEKSFCKNAYEKHVIGTEVECCYTY